MKFRSVLSFSLAGLFAACSPPQPPADSGVDAQSDSPSDSPSSDVAPDAPVVCCVAMTGTMQSVCDAVASFGPDRCNMINGGTSCSWNPVAACRDGGAPSDAGADSALDAADSAAPADASNMDSAVQDAQRPDAASDSGAGCCRARPGSQQALCDMAASLGPDRCRAIGGGAACVWLTGSECATDAAPPPPVDASRCCQARPGTPQSVCDPLESLGRDRCNMINGGASCAWSCP
ncbi:MAG: hypothetical protein JNK05_37250 [Myxococcales bacterium]|nr:hypothetical protein [Myxococcales bacterium]